MWHKRTYDQWTIVWQLPKIFLVWFILKCFFMAYTNVQFSLFFFLKRQLLLLSLHAFLYFQGSQNILWVKLPVLLNCGLICFTIYEEIKNEEGLMLNTRSFRVQVRDWQKFQINTAKLTTFPEWLWVRWPWLQMNMRNWIWRDEVKRMPDYLISPQPLEYSTLYSPCRFLHPNIYILPFFYIVAASNRIK